jgi:hypothetical protein
MPPKKTTDKTASLKESLRPRIAAMFAAMRNGQSGPPANPVDSGYEPHEPDESDDPIESDEANESDEASDAKKGKAKKGKAKATSKPRNKATPKSPTKAPPQPRKPRTTGKDKKEYLDLSVAPISQVPDMFADMLKTGLTLNPDLLKQQSKQPLVVTVGTVCSGTEAPMYAFNFLAEAARNQGTDMVRVKHAFSCEIEGFKQAFIHRNHDAPLIFRNVVHLGKTDATQA